MLAEIALVAAVAALYGLAWHNQPAKQPAVKELRRSKKG